MRLIQTLLIAPVPWVSGFISICDVSAGKRVHIPALRREVLLSTIVLENKKKKQLKEKVEQQYKSPIDSLIAYCIYLM